MQDPAAEAENAEDLTLFIQDMLDKLQKRVQTTSTTILNRIDEMGTRLDDLEKTIGDLVTQEGLLENSEN